MAVTWELTGIQEQAFTMTANLYRPKIQTIGVYRENRGFELVASGIPMRIMGKSEASALIAALGRANVDQMDTTDVIRTPVLMDGSSTVPVGDQWIFEVTAGANSETGWWKLQGEQKNLVFRARQWHFLAAKVTAPEIE